MNFYRIISEKIIPGAMEDSVVLVTGGSGFLGQHVIKHLQILANHVKEIRVLDIVDYVQKLGAYCFLVKYV